METLERLQKWYASQCDGEWEHQCGVRVESLDNPGWSVRINLEGTELLHRPFSPTEEGTGSDGHPEQTKWIACFVRDGAWNGASDESQLDRILTVFLDWAEAPSPTTP